MSRPIPAVPGPGQESVWDYPRPPALERVFRRVEVVFGGELIVDASEAYRVLETSHPPTYYMPPESLRADVLRPTPRETTCEWKGVARHFSVVVGGAVAEAAAWSYPTPTPRYAAMAGWVAFYPRDMEACRIDGVAVTPQPGGFYGGWVTPEIAGPLKGAPGSEFW